MSRGRGNAGKGARKMKNKSYYERQVGVTAKNKARRVAETMDFIAEALTRTSANAVAKRALRERKREGTAYFGPPVMTANGDPKLPASKAARAEVSVTVQGYPLTVYRLPIDQHDPTHVKQAVSLLVDGSL